MPGVRKKDKFISVIIIVITTLIIVIAIIIINIIIIITIISSIIIIIVIIVVTIIINVNFVIIIVFGFISFLASSALSEHPSKRRKAGKSPKFGVTRGRRNLASGPSHNKWVE